MDFLGEAPLKLCIGPCAISKCQIFPDTYPHELNGMTYFMLLEFSPINNDEANAGGTGLLLKPVDEMRFRRVGFVEIYKEALSQYFSVYEDPLMEKYKPDEITRRECGRYLVTII